MTRFACIVLLGLAVGCTDSSPPSDGGGTDATSPDSAAPDSSAPDSAAPDATSPDSAVPDSTVPDDTPPLFDSGIEEPTEHRAEAIPCDNERPSPPIEPDAGGGCTTHEECTEGNNGRCTTFPRGFTSCTYDACFDDSGCGTSVCLCENSRVGNANTCLMGNCQVDADCGEGNYCSPSFGDCGDYSGVVSYYCHSVDDECTNDDDCAGAPNAYCRFSDEVGHWACSSAQCVG